MKKENLFYLIFVLTIIVIRFLVWIFPNVDLTARGFVVHHFWFGVVLFLIGFFVLRIYLFGVGLGLVVDQLAFIVLGAGGDIEYWNLFSLVATFLLIIVFYFLRKNILRDSC